VGFNLARRREPVDLPGTTRGPLDSPRGNSLMASAFGWLHDNITHEPLRPATASERDRGTAAVTAGNPRGAFDDGDGCYVYVGGGEPPVSDQTREQWAQLDKETRE
jgi:hypothetical protein